MLFLREGLGQAGYGNRFSAATIIMYIGWLTGAKKTTAETIERENYRYVIVFVYSFVHYHRPL